MTDDYEYGIPDPEYGVFGDSEQEKPIPPRKSEAELKTIEEARIQRLREMDISSNFNRYMIDLYNQSRK